MEAAQEGGECLAVGGDRVGRLALDGAAGEVGLNEDREGRGIGIYSPSMDALLAAAAIKPRVNVARAPGRRCSVGCPCCAVPIGEGCRLSVLDTFRMLGVAPEPEVQRLLEEIRHLDFVA